MYAVKKKPACCIITAYLKFIIEVFDLSYGSKVEGT